MFEIKKITMIYDMEKEDKVYALNGFDLTLPDRGLVGIIGPSGSGKSTLMYCLSTLKKPTDGTILYNGRELTGLKDGEREHMRREEFGFVFQRHFLVSYMSALDNVTVAATKSGQETINRAMELLDGFGLGKKEIYKRPAQLSGGQRQRAAIARAMINSPNVLFADEPTASCIYTQKENKKIRKPQAADQTAFIFARLAAARLFSINSIRRLCWS